MALLAQIGALLVSQSLQGLYRLLVQFMVNSMTPGSAGCRLSLVIRVLEEETQDSGKISKATLFLFLLPVMMFTAFLCFCFLSTLSI